MTQKTLKLCILPRYQISIWVLLVKIVLTLLFSFMTCIKASSKPVGDFWLFLLHVTFLLLQRREDSQSSNWIQQMGIHPMSKDWLQSPPCEVRKGSKQACVHRFNLLLYFSLSCIVTLSFRREAVCAFLKIALFSAGNKGEDAVSSLVSVSS